MPSLLTLTRKLKKSAQQRGALGYFRMAPSTFLDLTSFKTREKIEHEALNLDQYNELIDKGDVDCMPYLRILEDGSVIAHEGRHRAVAVQNAGGGYIDVALIVMNKKPVSKKDRSAHPIEFDYNQIPLVWKSQFSKIKRKVPLNKFRYFADVLTRKHRAEVSGKIFDVVERAMSGVNGSSLITLKVKHTQEQRVHAGLKSIGIKL